jgi:prevent-host-death family protein
MSKELGVMQQATPTLEQKVELENVTKLRQNLLPIIERLEDEPALRFLILKHGKPQAVLMSYPTYELMQKLLNQAVEQGEAMTREERIASAVKQLRSERSSTRSRAASVAGQPEPQVARQVEQAMTILQQVTKQLRSQALAQVEVVNKTGG